MLAKNLLTICFIALVTFAFGSVALADDIGSEAGVYEHSFSTPVKSVDNQPLTKAELDRLATIGTEAGNWQQTSVDPDALQAAIELNQQRGSLVGIGTEAGNDTFDFDNRQDLICESMLC